MIFTFQHKLPKTADNHKQSKKTTIFNNPQRRKYQTLTLYVFIFQLLVKNRNCPYSLDRQGRGGYYPIDRQARGG
jgi:hypothetical protein